MATEWQIGDKIENRWEIHKILHGGMGIVYIVYDHEYHVPFAIKTYQDEIFTRNPKITERFRQEALAWVNLDIHQNVTRAHHVKKIQGKPYLFLEYVSGGDLSSWIGTPRLTDDLPQVLRMTIQFCDGMTHALFKGIRAHRDIKPQNCLVTEDRTLKVTDFGLAKVFEDTDGLQEGDLASNVQGLGVCQTQTGRGAGTPQYMAPEQFEDIKHVGVPADIYAFGVMLYEMVTGRLPFVGRTVKDYMRLHKEHLPMTAHIDPESLREIMETCLKKDPSKRFGDFAELHKELADIYEKATQSPAPQPVGGLELDGIQLNNKGVSLGNLGHYEEALACYDHALELNPQDEQAWYNKGVAFANLGRAEEALSCFDRALQLNPQDEQTWYNKGVALGDLGRAEEALSCFDRTLQINSKYEQAWYNKGNALDDLRRPEEALSCYDRALRINPKYEKAWHNKGVALGNLSRFEEALACYDHALELNPQDEQAWYNKGVAFANLGRAEEALSCYDRALRINPKYEKRWNKKGNVLVNLGHFEEALSCYDQALEINPKYEEAWYNKGVALANLGRFEEALSCYIRTLQINPQDGKALANKGAVLANLGRYEEALSCYDRTLQINPQDEKVWAAKGVTLANLGRLEEALSCFEEAQSLGHP